jgi:glutaminyl-tRNA synthetase
LKFAYYITCNDAVKDNDGNVVELHCTYDPKTKGGMSEDGRKVRGTLHWVNASEFIEADIRLYDRLFIDENPELGGDFVKNLNLDSLKTIKNAKLEMSLGHADNNCIYQFERTGYFILDSKDSKKEKLVFNRAVSLRDSWAKMNR